jgi:hypothetical protein
MKIRDVLDILSSSEIILEVDVIVLVEEPGKQALRARASLKNGFLRDEDFSPPPPSGKRERGSRMSRDLHRGCTL